MLKISRFDLKLPTELVQTCAALREKELAKFIATNNEGEFQHTIEVKSEKEKFVNFELSNLEITFKDGKFVAQIAQVLKVFQAPPEQDAAPQQTTSTQDIDISMHVDPLHIAAGSFSEKQSPTVTPTKERLVSPISGAGTMNSFRSPSYGNSQQMSMNSISSQQPQQAKPNVNTNTAEEDDDDIIVVKEEDMISRRSKNVAEVTIEPSLTIEPAAPQTSQIYPQSLSQVFLNAPSTVTSISNIEQLVQPSTSQQQMGAPLTVTPPSRPGGPLYLQRKMAKMHQGKHINPQVTRPRHGESSTLMRQYGTFLTRQKGFVNDTLFKRRKKICSNSEKNFVCNICSKAFVYKLSLQRHTEACHNSNPAYTCSICQAVTHSKCSLRRHIEGVHKMTALRCQWCHGYFTEHAMKDHKCSGSSRPSSFSRPTVDPGLVTGESYGGLTLGIVPPPVTSNVPPAPLASRTLADPYTKEKAVFDLTKDTSL